MTSMKTVGYTLETVNLIRDEADFDRLLQLTTYQHRSEDRMSSASADLSLLQSVRK